jgi:hypothetical protein
MGLSRITPAFHKSIFPGHQADLPRAFISAQFARIPAGYEQQIKGDTTMFTLTKIAIAATFIFGAVSASLAYDENAKWYPETPQDFKQTHRATDTFRSDAYDSVKSDQKRGSSQKILERNNH